MTETQKAEKKVQTNLNIIIEHNKIELELNNNIKLLNNDILLYKRNIRTLEIENDKLRSEIVVKGQNYGKLRMYVYVCIHVLLICLYTSIRKRNIRLIYTGVYTHS